MQKRNERTLTIRIGSGRETSATRQIEALFELDLQDFDVQVDTNNLSSPTVEVPFDYVLKESFTSSAAFMCGSGETE